MCEPLDYRLFFFSSFTPDNKIVIMMICYRKKVAQVISKANEKQNGAREKGR